MTDSRTLRHVGAVCLALTILLIGGEVVYAKYVNPNAMPMGFFCSFWHSQYGVGCSSSCGDLSWQWSGSYNFSEMNENDALSLAHDLCEAGFNACWETCEDDDFRWWMKSRHDTSWCEYDLSCFFGFTSQNTCIQGVTGSYGCTCTGINYCMPCEQ